MRLSISKILAGLESVDRDLLTYAFENGISNQFVRYEGNKFIGVNIDPDFKMLHIIQHAGRYSEGDYIGEVSND